jgi:hypothetical protein
MTEKTEQARQLASLFRIAPHVEIMHPQTDVVGVVTPDMCQIIADALEEWARKREIETTDVLLMAAAPDLLAALARMIGHAERLNLYSARGEEADVMSQAREAITKALGPVGDDIRKTAT